MNDSWLIAPRLAGSKLPGSQVVGRIASRRIGRFARTTARFPVTRLGRRGEQPLHNQDVPPGAFELTVAQMHPDRGLVSKVELRSEIAAL